MDVDVSDVTVPDVGVPDSPSVFYIDLPTEHQGTDLSWTLTKKVEPKWHSYGSSYYTYDGEHRSGYGYETEETTITLTMHFETVDGQEAGYSENIEDILDKDIIAGAKTLINKKERIFRNLLLDNGSVQIWPKPKPSSPKKD